MSGTAAPVEVVTFGCRLNIVESDAIRREATAAGHTGLVVVNSCAVTAEAARQARQAIRRLKRERPEARIVVTGCAAEVEADSFAAMPQVAALVPNARKALPATWARGDGGPRLPSPAPDGSARHTRGFIEIQNGCDHACTFCVIPFGRGPSRSVTPEAVIARLRALVQAGAREAVLTGVDITSYEAGGLRLGGLVRRVLDAVPDLERLRLSSIDCIEADPELLAVIASEPRFMPHLHLSLQSGADLILKRMKRRHSRAEAIEFCATVRALRPEMVLGADVIVGFPTETDRHFDETQDLVEACGITHLHVFPYSARPGTPAARMPAVPGEVAKARAAALRAQGAAALRRHLDRQVGRRLRVLSEKGGRGRAEDFTAVQLGDIAPNRMIEVDIADHDGRTLMGAPAAALPDRESAEGGGKHAPRLAFPGYGFRAGCDRGRHKRPRAPRACRGGALRAAVLGDSTMSVKTVLGAGLLLAAAALPGAASAGPVGQLSCNVAGGVGLIITSSRALNCEYQPANGAKPQHYVGTVGRFGLDLGVQGPGRLTWNVVTVGGPVGPGALAGSFAGGTASATVGSGVGVNALVGGNGSITLQPLSVQTQSGLNVAAGVGTLTLDYAP